MQNLNVPCEDDVMSKRIFALIAALVLINGFAFGATLTVDQGGGGYATIQEAIDAAVSGVDEIEVAAGVYSGAGNIDLDFGGKALVLRSSNPADSGVVAYTVIDCQRQGRAFIFQNGEGLDSVVNGFTIINGNDSNYGGAIECDRSSPSILNCVFSNCLSSYDAGAIDCYGSSPLISNCLFENNEAVNDGGAIECYVGSNPEIVDCVFNGNKAGHSGGGIDCYSSVPSITNCVFSDNTATSDGGAIECYEGGSAIITNCLIVNNTANRYGGGIDSYESGPVISYCTISGNQGGEVLGGIGGINAEGLSSSVVVTSCIIYGNGVSLSASLDTGVTYSCVEGGHPDASNIDVDPLFRKGDGGDYYLSQEDAGQISTSLCVDGGDPLLLVAGFDPGANSTRTDNQADDLAPDMGYHYPTGSVPDTFELTAGIVPDPTDPLVYHGSISVDGIDVAVPSVTAYVKYSEVELFSTPDIDGNGYEAGGWQGIEPVDIYDAGSPRNLTVTILEDREVNAIFDAAEMYVLTLEIVGDPAAQHGSVVSSGQLVDGSTNEYWQIAGSSAIITATPDAGYQVRNWTGTFDDAANTGQTSVTVVMDESKTVTVEFVSGSTAHLDVRVVGGHGSVTPKRTDVPVGTVVDLLALPDAGYRVKEWIGTEDDSSTEPNNSVEMTWSKDVTVEFEVVPYYTLYLDVYTIDGDIHGTIGVVDTSMGPDYVENERVEILAVPDAGYEVYRWWYSEDDTSQEPNNFIVMDSSKRVYVQFREESLPIGGIVRDSDWDTFYPTIQAAIDAVNLDGFDDEVIVGEGTYTGDGNRNLNMLGGLPDNAVNVPAITVRSERGAVECIIDCEGAAQGFIFAGPERNIHVVRGFTIMNGVGGQGGGLYFGSEATPIVDECIIINCHSTEGGGGVWFEGPPEDPIDPGDVDTPADFIPPNFSTLNNGIMDAWDLDDDGVIDEAVDAADTDGDGVPDVGQIDDARVPDPVDPPEPVVEYAIVSNSVIQGNSSDGNGGGVYVTNGASPWITSTVIRNNTAINASGGFGGGVYSDLESVPAIINCLLTGNESSEIGGAIYLFESDAIIRLCTIVYNVGLDYNDEVDGIRVGPKGGIAARDSDPEINHCIIGRNGSSMFGNMFWGNVDTWGDDLFECEATYSCIENGDDGDGNLTYDPQVVLNDPEFVPGPDPYWNLPFAADTVYLSHETAGQPITSPAVDTGEQYALGDIQSAYLTGDNMTTSINNDYDIGFCDMGFHYPRYDGPLTIPVPPDPYRKYFLTVVVINRGSGPHGYVDIIPESDDGYERDQVVDLVAYADAGYRVRDWNGADNSPAWNSVTNTVTMDDDKIVYMEFERDMQRHLLVPLVYLTIEDAVAASSPGDIIIVDPGVHYLSNPDGIDFLGRAVELRSTDPDNDGIIAQTIIDCQGTRYLTKRAFQFVSGEDSSSWIRGFTIRNGFYHGLLGAHGFEPGSPIDLRENPLVRFSARHGEDAIGDGYGGAILCSNGSSPLFEHCVFTNNTVTGGYGGDGATGITGFYNDGKDGQWGGNAGYGEGNGYGGVVACLTNSSPMFRYCVFADNIAMGGCGGAGGDGGDEDPIDGGNAGAGGDGGFASGVGIGGVVYAEDGSLPLFEDCEFTNNIARWGLLGEGGSQGEGGAGDPEAHDGSGGYYSNSWFYIFDPIFFPGFPFIQDTVAGGAAYYATTSDVSFVDSTFSNNRAFEVSQYVSYLFDDRFDSEIPVYTLGGAIYSEPYNRVTLVGCEFLNGLGGAVYCESDNIVTITESRDDNGDIKRRGLFKNNQSLEDVDYANTGFYGDYYYQYFFYGWYNYDNYFQGDNRNSPGGALFIGPDGNLTVSNTDFQNNVAYNGGAINTKSNSTFESCMFNGNKAGGYGGAIDAYINTGAGKIVIDLHFDTCTFAGNSAVWGGGVHTHDFNASFIDSYMVGNTAQSGGALFLSEGNATISGGLYRDNVVIDESPEGLDGIGGAVAAITADMTVSNSEWFNNKSVGNKASGGAIAFYGGDNFSRHLVNNSLFVDNSATIKGGAISGSIFTDPNIANCTFVNNSAEVGGGAIGCDWMSSLEVVNSIFDSCGEHAIAEEDFNSSLFTNNLFNNNGGSDYGIYYTDPGTELGEYDYIFTTSEQGTDIGSGNISGDPLFVSGPLGDFYLSQSAGGQPVDSPALNYGIGTVVESGLAGLTTCSLESGILDSNPVDLGYHYMLATVKPRHKLTVTVIGGHGSVSVSPESEDGMYYAGSVVKLIASPELNYRVGSWSGGTIDDLTRDPNNLVIMGMDKDIVVQFDQPRLLIVGSQSEFTSIQQAVDAAKDGDIVMIQSGQYPAVEPWSIIDLWGKDITIAGANPDDPDSVSETVLSGYWFWLTNVGSGTVIEGITIQAGRMHLESSSPIIRNCKFISNHWRGVDGTAWDGPTDGESGAPSFGGAIRMYDSSPQILGCTFEDCSVTGGDGFDGDGGVSGHPYGYDGGWAGRAYGGAVYAAWKSNPVFKGCEFTDCFAQGGNGGNGGNGIDGADGGRGGSWMWSDTVEGSMYWIWWDGWDQYSMGDKFGPYGWFYWTGWINYNDEWYQDYLNSNSSSVTDPYDAYYDYWKYSGYGGAFYCEVDCSVKFNDCTFTNNNSYGGVCGIGGGPYVEPGPDRPINIDTAGGAIYISDGCTAEFVDCAIIENTADMTTVDDTVQLTFDGPEDYYVSFGGGVGIEKGSDVTFIGCEVQGNAATIGGGIYWADSDAMIDDCNVVGNLAYHGAGLYSTHSTGDIDRTFVTSNYASETPPASTDPTGVVIDPNSVPGGGTGFFHSVLGQGGGYSCLSSLVDIANSEFRDNVARSSGGAIYYAGSDEDQDLAPKLFNSLISNNTAGRDGGGISINWYAEPDIANCTISDNMVTGAIGAGFGYGGGIYASYNSRAYISDSIIWGNAGANGAQIAVASGDEYGSRPSEVKIVFSDIGPHYDPNEAEIFADDDGQGATAGIDELSSSSGSAVLTDAQMIYDEFDSGESTAKVIVTLRGLTEMSDLTNWDSPISSGQMRASIGELQASVLSTLSPSDFVLKYQYKNIAGFAGSVSPAGLEKLISNPKVAYIEPERYVQPMLAQAIPLANALAARQAYDGRGISIAIVDSGIDYTHERLGGGGFPNNKVIGGYDFGMNDPDPMPTVSAHGTACAGIAAGDLGTVGDYIGGVAYGSRLYALKIADDFGALSIAAAIASWDWCVTNKNNDPQNPIMVISNSWGFYGLPFNNAATADAFVPALTAVADVANKAGIAILASSGNDGFAGNGISHPSAMSTVISVGAVFDTTDAVTGYSNAGDLLDILAPGDPIYTTDIVGLGGYDPGDYTPYFNGTSASCPFAAGCVASVQSAALQKINRYLLPDEMRNLLVATGVPVTDTKVAITKPRVNLGAAISNLVSVPVYVEEDCLLHWWDAENEEWLPDANNIDLDPLMIGDYFLSEIVAGQLAISPAVDFGSGPASSKLNPISGIALDQYTTRTDSVFDDFGDDDPKIVNIGYHHPEFEVEQYRLNFVAIVDPFELPDFDPVVIPDIPDGAIYDYGTQVELSVTAPPFGFHAVWNGSDDDFSNEPENVVTMDDDRMVTVRFETIGYTLDAEVIVDANILPNFTANITLDPPGGVYYPNTEVTLTVTPPPAGYQVRWTGTDDGTIVGATNVVTMNSDKEVTAEYVAEGPEYYAVIVGISDYYDFFFPYIELPFAALDATSLRSRLVESDNWDEDNIITLLDSQATKAGIRVALQGLSERLDSDDVLVFYFSGIGFADIDIDPIDEIDGEDEYLITYEYDGIRDDELGQMLAEFATDNYIVLLESDFSAGQIDGIYSSSLGTYNLSESAQLQFSSSIASGSGLSFSGDEDLDPLPQDLNRNNAGVVLTACGVDEIAFYSGDFRHGVFTYYLLKAIEGSGDWLGDNSGYVSAEEAYDYLAPRVDKYIADMVGLGNLPLGTTQRPRIYDYLAEEDVDILNVGTPDMEPTTWYVPGDSDRIQDAVDKAKDGDVIVLGSNVYREGNIIIDKAITLTSSNPDDPDVVAMTVIDVSRAAAGFGVYFTSNTGPETVLNGVTIQMQNRIWQAASGNDGLYGEDAFGAAVYVGTGASPMVKNCVITGFTIYAGDGGDGDEDDTNFFFGDGGDGGSAIGGGVYCFEESSPTFINTTISDCHVFAGNGGNGATANEYNFGGGRGGWGGWARGGGVYVEELAEPLFISCTISNCSATGGNGGNGGDGADVNGANYPPGFGGSWSDDLYFPWQAYGYEGNYRLYSAFGGGVYCATESKSKFVDCTISNNQTQGGTSGVGGVSVGGGILYPWEMYEIPSQGGGVYCASDSIVEFDGCTISSNVAPKPGAVLVIDPALGYGGGIALDGTESAKFTDCLIMGNESSIGGGIYWQDNDLLVKDCNVMENLAYNGGGIYGLRGDAVIDGGFVHGNYAGSTASDPEQVVGRGGGIHLASVTADIRDLELFGNQASTSGGGLYLIGTEAQSATVKNSLFVKNIAGRDGAGMSANWYSEPTISNCTFSENWATGYFGFTVPGQVPADGGGTDYSSFGGGLYCGYNTNATVINSIFWGNSATATGTATGIGYQIAVGTGFEFDPRPSTLRITYSDIQGGSSEPGVYVEEGCDLDWPLSDSGNIHDNPMFVTGPRGDYYLSQTITEDPVQDEDSPCVDAGSDLAGVFGMDKYITRTDNSFDNFDIGIVDMGFHYKPRYELDPCKYCDVVADGKVNLEDYVLIASYWLSLCDEASGWCDGADINTDKGVDVIDLIKFANCWLVEDDKAPVPDPSEWLIKPALVAGSITSVEMTAMLAQDAWWGERVEYRFDCWVGDSDYPNAPDYSSDWRQDYDENLTNYVEDPQTYTHSGLTPALQYRYRVIVRDILGNETAYSSDVTLIPALVADAPSPNPAMWRGQDGSIDVDVDGLPIFDGIPDIDLNLDGIPDGWPVAMSGTSLRMAAHQGTSPLGNQYVEYQFIATDATGTGPAIPGGTSSEWQQNHSPDEDNYTPTPWIYYDDGLTPLTTYYYRVSMRVAVIIGGEVANYIPGQASVVASGMPDLAVVDFGAPQPDPPLWSFAPEQLFVNGKYWHHMIALPSADPEGNGEEYFFQCTSKSDYSSGWLNVVTNPSLDPYGLPAAAEEFWVEVGASGIHNTYRFKVRDLSPNANETGWSVPLTVP